MRMYTIGTDILDHWHWLEPMLKPAMDRDLNPVHTTGHWLADILAGRSFVLVVEDLEEPQMVVILMPGKTILHLEAWAGDGSRKYLPAALARVQEIARGFNARQITTRIRPGGMKLLQKLGGYKVHSYYMNCEVV